MFQLVFVQFNLMRQVHLAQAELTQVAILGKASGYIRYQLIGGGGGVVAPVGAGRTPWSSPSPLV